MMYYFVVLVYFSFFAFLLVPSSPSSLPLFLFFLFQDDFDAGRSGDEVGDKRAANPQVVFSSFFPSFPSLSHIFCFCFCFYFYFCFVMFCYVVFFNQARQGKKTSKNQQKDESCSVM